MTRSDERPIDALPDPTAVSGNELEKSRATRRRILDAARDLLAEQGYDRFSTGAVAARAGLTRPAMLYHFGSRQELVTATIHHLARRRIEMFQAAVTALDPAPAYDDPGFRAGVVALSWEQVTTPEFAAFAALMTAARTDPELRQAVEPAIIAYDRARHETALSNFPPGTVDQQYFELGRDIVRFVTEGVALQMPMVADSARRVAALQHFLDRLIATPPGIAFLESVVADRQAGASPEAPLPTDA